MHNLSRYMHTSNMEKWERKQKLSWKKILTIYSFKGSSTRTILIIMKIYIHSHWNGISNENAFTAKIWCSMVEDTPATLLVVVRAVFSGRGRDPFGLGRFDIQKQRRFRPFCSCNEPFGGRLFIDFFRKSVLLRWSPNLTPLVYCIVHLIFSVKNVCF